MSSPPSVKYCRGRRCLPDLLPSSSEERGQLLHCPCWLLDAVVMMGISKEVGAGGFLRSHKVDLGNSGRVGELHQAGEPHELATLGSSYRAGSVVGACVALQFFLRLNYLDMHRTYGCAANPQRTRPLCDFCGRKFCQPQKLKVHIKRMHSGECRDGGGEGGDRHRILFCAARQNRRWRREAATGRVGMPQVTTYGKGWDQGGT